MENKIFTPRKEAAPLSIIQKYTSTTTNAPEFPKLKKK